jgi:sec-independent protein translocase protein TatB
MFGISWHEYMLIAVVALIVIGPKELPRVLRAVGQWTAKVRRMAAEFQGQFQEALREAEMADLKKEVDNLSEQAKGFTSDFTSKFSNPLNFPEATKWEPRTDSTSESKTEPAPETGKSDDVVKSLDDSPVAAAPDAGTALATAQPPAEQSVTQAAAAPAGTGESAPKVEGSAHP